MTLIIITAVLFIIVLVGTIIVAATYSEDNKSFKYLPLASLLVLFVLLFGCVGRVSANEVGIIFDDRHGVLEDTYKEGIHWKSPMKHIKTISTTNRSVNIETTGQTNDGQYATFELSIIYKITTEDAGKFYKVVGDVDISKEQISSVVKRCLQSSTIKYDIFELLSEGLETARVDFQEDLTNELYNNYYITVVSVAFDDIDAGKNVEEILQSKAEAAQKIEIAKKDAEAKLITENNNVEVAKKQAEAKKALSEAEAYAIKIAGEANADAATAYVEKIDGMIQNLQDATGMTYAESADLVLSIVFYDTWNGELPKVLTSDDLSSMIGSLIANS